MATVVVAGAVANKCGNAGEAWVRASWVTGLRALGVDVYFVEEIAEADCRDLEGRETRFESSTNHAWFREVAEYFDLRGRSTLLCKSDTGHLTEGLAFEDMREIVRSADLLINISGHLEEPELLSGPRTRSYVDIDPGFTQAWADSGTGGARLEGHDLYFTIGERIGAADCPIPSAGVPWLHTRQPVVLDDWPVSPADPSHFTTVANWRGPYGPISLGAETYGLKVHEFRRFLELPMLVPQRLELALNIDPSDATDIEALRRHRWDLVDPGVASHHPRAFREYVLGSGGEFSVAQGVYVHTNSGWFSDRTTRYLAAGKPALVQDTGFSRCLPTGHGLVPFDSMADAIAGAEAIASDYDAHSAAARAVAETCFDSAIVLTRFLGEAGVS